MLVRMRCLAVAALLLAAAPAAAEKSNQIRPTPSPIANPTLEAGDWLITPKLAMAFYRDSLQTGIPNVTQDYAINSIGGVVQAQIGVLDWLSLDVGLEGYRKFG